MKKHLHCLLIFLLPFFGFSQIWGQLGQGITGEPLPSSGLGSSTSMSSDGSIVAVGQFSYNSGSTYHQGAAYVYQYNGTSWEQMGQSLYGTAAYDRFGNSVSLSGDGMTLVVGAYQASFFPAEKGLVRIYHFDGTSWVQQGADILGEANGGWFGYSVNVSSDGTTVAVGAYRMSSSQGAVYVYRYNGSEWTQTGQTLTGETASSQLGWSVAMNSDGSRMVVGSPGWTDGNVSHLGKAYIYQYNTDGNTWELLGNQDVVQGYYGSGAVQPTDTYYFGHSVDMNDDGTVVSVGGTSSGVYSYGHTQAYEYNGTSWEQLGQTLYGPDYQDYLGSSVSLNAAGDVMAVALGGDDTNGTYAGAVNIYEYNGTEWALLGNSILGNPGDAGSYIALNISLDSEGDKIAAGFMSSQSNQGQLRMYKYFDAPESVMVNTENNAEPIVSVGEVLQLEAVVLPVEMNQEVTWSIADGSGFASVDENGLVTGISEGVATVRATSVEDSSIYGEIEITVIYDPVVSISVNVENDLEPEIFLGETLQLEAHILPESANQGVTWSIVDGSGFASVDENGLVTGISEGIATVRAASVANPTIYADIEVTVVEGSLTVSAVNGADTNIVVAQTLQLAATVLPEETSQEVTWSVVAGDGYASVSTSGMVTGLAPGVATIRATSVPHNLLYGEIQITVYNVTQSVEITTVTGEPAQTYSGGTLPLQAAVLPDGANQEVTWSISSGSQYIAVSESGIVTGLQEGTATVRATSVQDSSVYGELEITVTEYCIPWFVTGCIYGDDINDFVMEEAGIIHYGSGCSENAYGDFTGNGNLMGTLEAGTPYDFTVNHDTEGMYVKIWIDLNGNGSFEDDGELLFASSSAAADNQTTGTITVPGTTSATTTRMRVMANWLGNAEDSCNPYGALGLGETHDYTVNIVEPVAAESIAVTTAEGEDQEIYVAETVQLEAAVSPEGAEQGVSWSVSAGADYATVDETGLVTGIAPGIATIRATSVENGSVYGEIEITVLEIMGVSDVNGQAVTLYPNPTTGILNIRSSGQIRQVEVFNLNGQSLMNAKTDSINLSVLPAGTYLVKVMLENGGTVIRKVIKK